jgi:hypothetical protein
MGVSVLRKRGLMRHEYASGTLREHLVPGRDAGSALAIRHDSGARDDGIDALSQARGVVSAVTGRLCPRARTGDVRWETVDQS